MYINDKYRRNNEFICTKRFREFLLVIDKKDWYQPQAFPNLERLFSILYGKGKDIGNKVASIFSCLGYYSNKFKQSFSVFSKIDWAKLGDLVISIFFSASTALCGIYGIIQFLYTLLKFVTYIVKLLKNNDDDDSYTVWTAQDFSLEALMAGFSLLGLPSWLLDKIKSFALLTGVKVHASHSFSSLFSKIKDLITSVISYIFTFPSLQPFNMIGQSFLGIINYLFSPFEHYDNILLVVEQYTQFIKDSSVLHNPVYRNEVSQLYNKLKIDVNFQDYIKNNDNRHFVSTWIAYKENLVKFVETYSSSSREEPICIVFDGPPASGKSVLMNKFVELLKANNMSVYTHTTPPIDSSKDFYDDYLNQDVFVMDDVGQQGKSQWRTIINFVSPVKYPLDCAQADKKNTKFFQSKIILCTTNNFRNLGGFVSKDGISCPEALFRRVHLIEVRRNSTFGFEQQLSYFKFCDRRNAWFPHFVGVNNIITSFSSNNGQENTFPFVIRGPRTNGLSVSVSWLFMLYKHLDESNRINRLLIDNPLQNNVIINDTQNNTATTLDYLSSFRPQFFEELLQSFDSTWNGLLNGSNIFKEYVFFISNFVEKGVKEFFTKIFIKIINPLSSYLIESISKVSEEFALVIDGIFKFLLNLFRGDFIEERQALIHHTHCYMCRYDYAELDDVDDIGRPVHVPIVLLPCGHSLCATCAVLETAHMRNNGNTMIRRCGMCRGRSLSTMEEFAVYVGTNQVTYEVVRNYVREGRAALVAKVYSVYDKFVDAIASIIDTMGLDSEFLMLLSLQIFVYVYIVAMSRLILWASGIDNLRPNNRIQSGSSIMSWFFGNQDANDITYAQFSESKKRSDSLFKDLTFNTSSAESFKKNHCRIMVNTKTKVHSCIVVSGRRFVTNSHVDPEGIIADVYQSYEHYKEGHKEMESVKIKVIKNYLLSDVCVCEFLDIVPFYKLFNRFGGTDLNKFSPNMFVSPYGIIPLVPSINVGKNKEKITYRYKIRGDTKIVQHDVNAGLQYQVQGAGLCGSVVYDSDRVVGIHVTGNGKEGFAQIFPQWLCEELNIEMNSKPLLRSFETRENIKGNFSGVRLTYEDDPKWINYGSQNIKTSFIPSSLHISSNEDTKQLYKTIHELQETGDIAPVEVELKQPPIFGRNMSQVKDNMIRIAGKSFKHQGYLDDAEMEYISKVIRAILPDKIHDLTDEETSFGGVNVKGFKKDTSNGFACLQGKENYLDFENKVLTSEGRKIIDRLKYNADNEIFDEDDFVCKETFKDELRNISKITEPRLFRVMPFPHIWWSKKILGELIPWFKNNLHKYGICVGFNPYTDFHKMVMKLKTGEVFGDEDYGKWDGSLLALIVLIIKDVFKSIYQGSNAKVLDYLMVTISRSWTLVADELYATTHSIPSGTWMTILINCLVNKALTALTIFRNNSNATVEDSLKVNDYVCGDDKIFSSSIKSNYNLFTVKNTAESLGMTVTNGDKTPITTASRDLMKLNFLKRNIVFHPILNKYVGALSVSTLFNTVQWYNADKVGDSLTYDDLMRDKCNAVLIESYLHSESCYNVFRDYFIKNGIDNLFSLERVLSILQDESGYEYVLDLLKKNYLN